MSSSTHPSRSPSPEDIAAAMGFASFGAKPNPPKKKRKLAGAEVNSEGSGSNNTPLGKGVGSRSKPEREGQQELGSHGHRGEGYGAMLDGQEVVGELNGTGTVDDGSYLIRPINPPYDSQPLDQSISVPGTGEEWMLEEARQRGLRRLEQMSGGGGGGGGEGRRADGEWDWNALRRGVRDERGDMAFYDASFVEDPWRHLGGDRGGEAAARAS